MQFSVKFFFISAAFSYRWIATILIFKEDHIPGNPYTRSMGIVTNITLVRDSITKKNKLNRLSSKFMSFMRREID